jgi:hypothetical protein
MDLALIFQKYVPGRMRVRRSYSFIIEFQEVPTYMRAEGRRLQASPLFLLISPKTVALAFRDMQDAFIPKENRPPATPRKHDACVGAGR